MLNPVVVDLYGILLVLSNLLLHKTSIIIKYHDMILKVFEKKCPTTNEDLKKKVNA